MRDSLRGNSKSFKSSVSSGNVRTVERDRRMQMMRVPRRWIYDKYTAFRISFDLIKKTTIPPVSRPS